MVKYRAVAVAVAVAVSGGGAVAVAVPVPVAGLTQRFFHHIQTDFLINVWSYTVHPTSHIGVNMLFGSLLGHVHPLAFS